jgi:hypothetical protein
MQMTSSTKKTGNESVSDIDPGGTHPTQNKGNSNADKPVEHHFETGDRNQMPKPVDNKNT